MKKVTIMLSLFVALVMGCKKEEKAEIKETRYCRFDIVGKATNADITFYYTNENGTSKKQEAKGAIANNFSFTFTSTVGSSVSAYISDLEPLNGVFDFTLKLVVNGVTQESVNSNGKGIIFNSKIK